MIPETVFGLPAHILIVHGVVVLVPLAALGTIAIAAVPRWRKPYGWLVVGLAVIGAVNTFAAVMAGENLEARLGEAGAIGGSVAEQVEQHEALGSTLRWYVLALALLAIAIVVLTRRGAARAVLAGVAIVAVLAAVLTGVQVVRTGHSGSGAVWNWVYESGD